MPASPTVLSAREQLHRALIEVRTSRHGMECRCGIYRPSPDNAPYCTRGEYVHSGRMDRLIDKALIEAAIR